MAGLYFEQLTVGLAIDHATRRTVTETDNVLFTTMTMNPVQIHLDADYCREATIDRPHYLSGTFQKAELHVP
jgi:acyl dehydratase